MTTGFTPIFSGGTGRSGTTIVGKLLSRHSQVKCGKPYEIRFMTEIFSLTDLAYGMRSFDKAEISRKRRLHLKLRPLDSYEVRLKKFEDLMLGHWYTRDNRLEKKSGLHRDISKRTLKSLLSDLRYDAKQDLEGACRDFFAEFVLAQNHYAGETNWMDTSPPNIMNAKNIFRLLPSAKFIEMQRNPLDTIASVMREKWGPSDFDSTAKWWVRRTEAAASALENIPRDQKLIIQLEDLVIHDRDATHQKILDFLDLEDENEVRDFFNSQMNAQNLNENRWMKDFSNPEEMLERFQKITEARQKG
tara:strand:- start:5290 stop:6198 length:909 start_codon:yes stop_codon:yes gene_type:complete